MVPGQWERVRRPALFASSAAPVNLRRLQTEKRTAASWSRTLGGVEGEEGGFQIFDLTKTTNTTP